MDKETALEIERIKARLTPLEKALEEWKSLLRNAAKSALKWLIGILATSLIFGWNLPENVRKMLVEWLTK